MPEERIEYQAALRRGHSEVWVFGGRLKNAQTIQSSILVADLKKGIWREVQIQSENHGTRRFASVIYEEHLDRFFLFGGVDDYLIQHNSILGFQADDEAGGWFEVVPDEPEDGPLFSNNIPLFNDFNGNKFLVFQPGDSSESYSLMGYSLEPGYEGWQIIADSFNLEIDDSDNVDGDEDGDDEDDECVGCCWPPSCNEELVKKAYASNSGSAQQYGKTEHIFGFLSTFLFPCFLLVFFWNRRRKYLV